MTDYNTWTPGRLRREVARRLGYTVSEALECGFPAYYVHTPDGRLRYAPFATSEDEALDMVTHDWAGSVDAALTLFEDGDPKTQYRIDRWFAPSQHAYRVTYGKRLGTISASGDELARLIVEVKLKWQDAIAEQEAADD